MIGDVQSIAVHHGDRAGKVLCPDEGASSSGRIGIKKGPVNVIRPRDAETSGRSAIGDDLAGQARFDPCRTVAGIDGGNFRHPAWLAAVSPAATVRGLSSRRIGGVLGAGRKRRIHDELNARINDEIRPGVTPDDAPVALTIQR